MEVTGPQFLSWLNSSIKRCEDKKTELQQALQNAVE